jgi:predicted regulator of Ras-like GTPase activity (Roadblock/LC7/MglB family)
MAELLVKQGQLGQALAMYRRLATERPGDLGVRQRLRALEDELGAQRGATMTFREHLTHIVDNVPGVVAGVIMGFDGIAIDTYEKTRGELDIAALLIEYSAAAEHARRAAVNLATPGAITEMAITGEKLTALMRPVTPEVFLGVVLTPEALTGKARYLMRIAAPKIAAELA